MGGGGRGAAPSVPGGNVDIIRQFIHRVPAVVVLPALVPSVAVQMLQIIFCCRVTEFVTMLPFLFGSYSNKFFDA